MIHISKLLILNTASAKPYLFQIEYIAETCSQPFFHYPSKYGGEKQNEPALTSRHRKL